MTPPMTPTPTVSAKEKALLPCPFCGGEPTVRTHQDESLWSHNIVTKTQIGCDECDVSFTTEPGYEFEAPEAWNRRAALHTEGEAEPVAWRYRSDDKAIWNYCEGSYPRGVGAEIVQPLYDRPPSAPAGVKVKPLEWRKEDDEDWWEAPALGYPAAYATWVSALGAVRLRLFREAAFSLFDGTLEEAKAAAQADYESRIRSSLQPDTQAVRCEYCDGTGDVHSIDGEWRGRCTCSAGSPDTQAAAASAPAQAEALPAGVDGDPHRFAVISADLCAAGVDVREALKALLDHVDVETCVHKETHRGGFLWTICDQCGRKWADDEGGFVPHADAPAVARARMICEALPAPDAKGER